MEENLDCLSQGPNGERLLASLECKVSDMDQERKGGPSETDYVEGPELSAMPMHIRYTVTSQRWKRKIRKFLEEIQLLERKLSGNGERRSRWCLEPHPCKLLSSSCLLVLFATVVHVCVFKKHSDSNKTPSKHHLERRGSSAALHNTF